MVLEKMLKGLAERRSKVAALRVYMFKMGSVDDGGDVDRLLGRFQESLEEVMGEIDRAVERTRKWFGEEKDAGH